MTSGVFGKIAATRLAGFFLILVAMLFLALSAVAYAEEITYTGDKNKLQEIPSWFFDESAPLFEDSSPSLFPGTMDTLLSSGNKITVNYNPANADVTNPGRVFGGISKAGSVPDNSVILLDGQIDSDVYGGFSVEGKVTGNTVTVSGGSIGRVVFGGFSKQGDAADNIITLNEGFATGIFCGGASQTKNAAGNSVTLLKGQVKGPIYGGLSGTGGVTGNRVTISGGAVEHWVVGGYGIKGRVSANIVTVSGGYVDGDVLGGINDAVVADNSVIISGGVITSMVHGGLSYESDAIGNSVTIGGGSVEVSVYGGFSSRGGNTTGNTVTVSGGAIGRGVFGGLSGEGKATGNTVTISGSPELARAYIWGGNTEGGNAFTGNTLNFKSSGISAESVNNFEYYNFYLPQNLTADTVMLSVKEAVNFQGTILKIFLQDGGKLNKGDKIALINSSAGVSGAPKNKSCQAKLDGALYEFSIYTDRNNLWAKLEKISPAAK